MAASLMCRRSYCGTLKTVFKAFNLSAMKPRHRRYLLSSAYSCNEAWKKRLEDPMFSRIPLSEFAIELRDQYDKQQSISAVDMEILANKLHEMDFEEADFMEDIMKRFRKSPESNPVQDSIVYAIVRNYIDTNMADRLLPLMKSRSETGIFPDPIASSLLLNHFIQDNDFASAAQVAYEMTLQEDFSHLTSFLLCLHATVQHLETLSMEDVAPDEIKDASGEEEEWVPVKYIRYPSYDDNFDIKCQQYLLGKTLYRLGREMERSTLSCSLQAVGLALYHKFVQCFQVLQDICQSNDHSLVQDCFSYIEESLEKVQVRDPEKPPKETGLLTIDDEIYKLLPTEGEKEQFQSQLQQLRQSLQDQGKVKEEKLSVLVDSLVKSQLPACEAVDIQVQEKQMEEWKGKRERLLKEKMYQLEKQQKMEEIERTLKELQEKEEMIRFFELHDKIRMIQPKKEPREKVDESKEDEAVLRAKRIKRRKFRHNV